MILLVAGCSATKQETCRDKQEATVVKNDFWDEQRKGTNFMNSTSLPDNYEEANEFNIEFVRLAPDKWAKDIDFLFNDQPDSNSQKGNADTVILVK